jgi:hypothetical protein
MLVGALATIARLFFFIARINCRRRSLKSLV